MLLLSIVVVVNNYVVEYKFKGEHIRNVIHTR